MPTYSFPAATFEVEGSPEAVREAGRAYGRFATTAAQAAADLRGLDSGAWVGSEGDLFRALDGFADALEGAQGRLAGVRADAEQTFSRLGAARNDQDRPRVERLEGDFDGQLPAAAGLRGQVVAAAQQAAQAIRAAGRASPTAGQAWLSGKGGLSPNIYGSAGDDPEDRSAIDDYQVVWKIWRSNSDEEMQLEIAWAIFQVLTGTVRWPAALVHGLDLLVATWDPERGLRRFPPLTTVDLQDEPLWR